MYIVTKLISTDVLMNQRMDEHGLPTLPPKDIIKSVALTEADAKHVAKDLALKNPMVPYGVFKAVHVYETAIPMLIEKEVNERGELIQKKVNI